LRDTKSARELLERLDAIFGGGFFERGELVITAVRDLQGVAKVAHKLQSRLLSAFGDVVEVKPEFIKEEEWRKPKFAQTTHEVQLEATSPRAGGGTQQEGPLSPSSFNESRELELPNICNIPENARVHPYLRPRLPTLEILLLWRCPETNQPKSHPVLLMEYPSLPKEEDLDRIFEEVAPYFQKRWVWVELRMGEAFPGFEANGEAGEEAISPAANGDGGNAEAEGVNVVGVEDENWTPAGTGLGVEVLACHPVGFAKDTGGFGDKAKPVEQCDPLVFRGTSDARGVVKICVLPALENKVWVPESEKFYSGYVKMPKASMTPMGKGVTKVPLTLVPKAQASMKVKVFVKPPLIPIEADIGDAETACVDWEMVYDREALTEAEVSMHPLDDPSNTMTLEQDPGEPGSYLLPSLAEGMVELHVKCPGYKQCTQALMILTGENTFYMPLSR